MKYWLRLKTIIYRWAKRQVRKWAGNWKNNWNNLYVQDMTEKMIDTKA